MGGATNPTFWEDGTCTYNAREDAKGHKRCSVERPGRRRLCPCKGSDAHRSTEDKTDNTFVMIGEGRCRDANGGRPAASIYTDSIYSSSAYTTIPNIEACRKRCMEERKCVGIEWQGLHNHCWLYGGEFAGHINSYKGARTGDMPNEQLISSFKTYAAEERCERKAGPKYRGCYKSRGLSSAVEASVEECKQRAVDAEKAYFAMEYPQGTPTVGKAQCRFFDMKRRGLRPNTQIGWSQSHDLEKVADSGCEVEWLFEGFRLGGSSLVAVYDVTHLVCAPWGCTCEGLSNTYGTQYRKTWGSAPEVAKDWWVVNTCTTS